jgi:hypothetical protein
VKCLKNICVVEISQFMMVLQEHQEPPSTADGKQTPPLLNSSRGGDFIAGGNARGGGEGGKLGGCGGEGGGVGGLSQ